MDKKVLLSREFKWVDKIKLGMFHVCIQISQFEYEKYFSGTIYMIGSSATICGSIQPRRGLYGVHYGRPCMAQNICGTYILLHTY